MSASVPIVRQTSWVAAVPQILVYAAAAVIGYWWEPRNGVLYGVGACLLYSIGSRLVIPRDHRSGVRLVRQQKFAEAIPQFEGSLAFFERHAWIDRFRSIVMMSPSALSYREMALCNIGYCYGQLGDGKQARAYYEKCLERFPDSGIAQAALRLLDAGSQAAKS